MKEKYNNLFTAAALVFIFIGAISFSVLYNVFTKSTTISLNAIGLAINCCIVFRWTYLVEKKKPQHDNIRELTDYIDELAKEQSENWLLLKIYLLNTWAFVMATKGGFRKCNIVTIICLVSSIGLGVFFAQKKPMEE